MTALEQYLGGLSDKRVGVIGAGVSNMPLIRMLRASGVRVTVHDKKEPTELGDGYATLATLGVDFVLGEHYLDALDEDVIFRTPGVHPRFLEKAQAGGSEITSEMELFFAVCPCPIIGITGSDGKTTTTTLVSEILRHAGYTVHLGGNIGTPLSEYLLSGEKADVLVLETSSFQLQCCSTFHPRVAVVLNISPNHLDYHKDMEEYIEAKFRLFRCQTEEDLAVLEPGLEETAARFGLRARKVWIRPEGRFPDCPLFGQHNQFNAEAAWQACRPFGVTLENAARAVAAFKPLPNRLESVARVHGVLYVNDSKCTTVAALEVALEAMDHPVHLLCGGKFKGGDLDGMKDLLRRKAKSVNLYGASREIFEAAWQGVVPLCWHERMEDAVLALQGKVEEGDVVLLAPATSSFDQYRNYVERGNDFKRIVGSLA